MRNSFYGISQVFFRTVRLSLVSVKKEIIENEKVILQRITDNLNDLTFKCQKQGEKVLKKSLTRFLRTFFYLSRLTFGKTYNSLILILRN